MKKLSFSLLLLTIAAVAAPAQTRTDVFVGTWKLVSAEPEIPATIEYRVESAGGSLVFTRTTVDAASGRTVVETSKFKARGESRYSLAGGMSGGRVLESLEVFGDRRLRLRTSLDGTMARTATSEYWTVSDDGKTLTIERSFSMSAGGDSGGDSTVSTLKLARQ